MPSITKNEVKVMISTYLEVEHSINPRRLFCCLNPQHEDTTPSMSYNPRNETVHCFGCGVTYDIFDLVELDYPCVNARDKFIKTYQIYHQYKKEGII